MQRHKREIIYTKAQEEEEGGNAFFLVVQWVFKYDIYIYMLCAKYGFGPSEDFAAHTATFSWDDRGIIARRAEMHGLSIHRTFVAMDSQAAWHAQSITASLPWMAELLCVRDRPSVCCHRWPRFGCAILEDCVKT